ncbi:MAG: permease-like cell division protein FtsX [Desulfobacterales bacterium]|nr:permease-like cell division protein FtsX [Desulfobacterales bacterium]
MILYYKRAIRDFLTNKFINIVTVITIALSVLIVSAFALFFTNAAALLNSWERGIRVMAYLEPGLSETELQDAGVKIHELEGVREARFISRQEALERLKAQMEGQASLLSGLRENPLPDAYEITLTEAFLKGGQVKRLADKIASLAPVSEVEYGQRWLGRFTNVINLFRLTGYALGGLFFMAAVFIVANTIRLVLYSRREEVEIMRLVGAADRFITAPFYIQGLLHGALGGTAGLLGLYATYLFISAHVEQGFAAGLPAIRFFPLDVLAGVLLGSMLVGWLGCYLSLKQFFKS